MTKHDETPGVGREFLWGVFNSVVISAAIYGAAAYLLFGGSHSMSVEVTVCLLLALAPLGTILWGLDLQSRQTTGQALAVEASLKGTVPVVDTPEGM